MTTTPQTNRSLGEIALIMRENDDFVICGHVSPDGDCLGCQLALYHALKSIGKNATCILVKDDPISASLAFMPGIGEMIPADKFEGTAHVFVGVDVPVRDRIGYAATILDRCEASVTIDHHASETTMCQHVYVDPDAASASMIVWELVKKLVDEPPLESALCAFTGLVTDTGGFRFQNSDDRAFVTAGELVAYGVDPATVSTHVFQNRSSASLKLESLVIERMRVFHDGDAVLSWITKRDMLECGAVKSDTEPLIDTIRALQGTRIAAILREEEGHVRGSLRSKDATDVSVVARLLGGGGHKAAAGLTIEGELSRAISVVEEKVSELLDGKLGA